MEQKRKWKLSDLWELLRNGFSAIITGNLLLRLNAGKYFNHIAYTFVLFWILIFESLMAEKREDQGDGNRLCRQDLQSGIDEQTKRSRKTAGRAGVNGQGARAAGHYN